MFNSSTSPFIGDRLRPQADKHTDTFMSIFCCRGKMGIHVVHYHIGVIEELLAVCNGISFHALGLSPQELHNAFRNVTFCSVPKYYVGETQSEYSPADSCPVNKRSMCNACSTNHILARCFLLLMNLLACSDTRTPYYYCCCP